MKLTIEEIKKEISKREEKIKELKLFLEVVTQEEVDSLSGIDLEEETYNDISNLEYEISEYKFALKEKESKK